MKIELSHLAEEDIKDIKNHIAKDSEYYAEIFIEKIFDSIQILEYSPKIGRYVPEIEDKDVREIFLKSYRIIYRIEKEKIYILTVIHGARDLTNKKNRKWEID